MKGGVFLAVRQLVRQNARFFLLGTIAALGLRLLFILRFPGVSTDSFVYGDIAKNWLQVGIYGLSGTTEVSPTYIRLPGYPAFLAWAFAIFGIEHYRAVLLLQMCVDIGTCFVVADIARRTVSSRAAKAAFLLTALCPFLATYAAAALTETLEIFFTALALDYAIVGLDGLNSPRPRLRPWIGCGLAVAAAILLRPDGGLLLVAIGSYLVWRTVRRRHYSGFIKAAVVFVTVALAPLIPWTSRNFYTFHRFEPLAPRYANEEDQLVPAGFNRWVKTWIVDYASVEEIYWPVPGEPIDASKLPNRAFDSEQERRETIEALMEYNRELHITPELDARFAALAEQRIQRAPLRYYVWLPMLRIADMWLRPRTETLPADTRWWEFNDEPKWSALAIALGVIGLFYVGAAVAGLAKGKPIPYLGLLLTLVVLRSVFLGTLENPEPRYTLEMYPVVIVLTSLLSAGGNCVQLFQGCKSKGESGLR
jgi:4-amino-4-deoxy-L-arabinose transferase-like glycosyltransferase